MFSTSKMTRAHSGDPHGFRIMRPISGSLQGGLPCLGRHALRTCDQLWDGQGGERRMCRCMAGGI